MFFIFADAKSIKMRIFFCFYDKKTSTVVLVFWWRRRRDLSGLRSPASCLRLIALQYADRYTTPHSFLRPPDAVVLVPTRLPALGFKSFRIPKNKHRWCLFFGGGEGPTIPKSKFYFTIPVTIEMVLYRSMQIEDLLFENKIFW